MRNHWLYHRGKRLAIRDINGLLSKFVGHKIAPLDELFADLCKVVIKYFKSHQDKLKYFSDGQDPFEYNFEVEEQHGYVTHVDFQA